MRNWTLIEAMASCHAITYIKDELIGDPLEIKMFESTKWRLIENDNNNQWMENNDLVQATVYPENAVIRGSEISDNSTGSQACGGLQIIKRFEFESKLQRMSVLCKSIGSKTYKAFVKGSPEKIEELCRAKTLPDDFQKQLDIYTRKGYRVIALAYKEMESMSYMGIQKMTREEIECDLSFLGFLVMENRLKPESVAAI